MTSKELLKIVIGLFVATLMLAIGEAYLHDINQYANIAKTLHTAWTITLMCGVVSGVFWIFTL